MGRSGQDLAGLTGSATAALRLHGRGRGGGAVGPAARPAGPWLGGDGGRGGVALLISTQVNFALSSLFTWRDRRLTAPFGLALLTRWATYQWSGAAAAALNMLVFALARLDLSVLAAAALGTLVAGVANFVAGDRLVFRERPVY